MYGLLSDFGDFDQCLSIRSQPGVGFNDEAEEGAYSGKYCLLSLKLKYRIKLEPNTTVPEGIIPDGVLWDELIRHYWTSNSTKGFQLGVCVPSRCTNDDVDQIYQYGKSLFQLYSSYQKQISSINSNRLETQSRQVTISKARCSLAKIAATETSKPQQICCSESSSRYSM